MGDRREWLCPPQRALSRRGGAGSDGEGAARVFRLEPEGAPHTETSHQLIYCRPRLRGDDIGWVWRAMPSIDRQTAFSGTKEVADALAIDAARLEAFLASRLHSVDPAALGLGDFGRGDNYVARQVERWSKQYRASETDGIAEMERLIAWLPSHLPPPAPVRVVHGDYRLDNIILAPREPTIRGVLDWELSTLGDPLADLAYHLMQWNMPPSESGAGVGTLLGHDLGRLGIPTRAAYVDAYVARTGLDPRPHLPVYLAYNFFRLAAILQGIVGRVRDGTATSETAAAMAPLVRPLAVEAWEFAREAGARW